MKTHVSAVIDATLAGATELVFAVQAAESSVCAEEDLVISIDGRTVDHRAFLDVHGTRLAVLSADGGRVQLSYQAQIVGHAPSAPVDPVDLIRYTRPSRYCESDTLQPTAHGEFRGLAGTALLDAVVAFVSDRLSYISGSSSPTDGAVQTLLDRAGVCRDYAHLSIALLRAMDVPARLASVYAPGLFPMDFHAVAEAYVEGDWHVVDATMLAPRQTLVRIATGRDASDTAFLTNLGSGLRLDRLEVMAVADSLPFDDTTKLVRLA